MRNDFSYDYDILSLSDRINACASARDEARADAERGDFLNPYTGDDPRASIYRTEFWAVTRAASLGGR